MMGGDTQAAASAERLRLSTFSHPDFNCRPRNHTGSADYSARGLYRRWGLSPRPEGFQGLNITRPCGGCQGRGYGTCYDSSVMEPAPCVSLDRGLCR